MAFSINIAVDGSPTSVSATTSDQTILAANRGRKGSTIYNDSAAILYLLLANQTSSPTVHTVQIAGGGYYETPVNYTGVIKGLWGSATGSARVTELV